MTVISLSAETIKETDNDCTQKNSSFIEHSNSLLNMSRNQLIELSSFRVQIAGCADGNFSFVFS